MEYVDLKDIKYELVNIENIINSENFTVDIEVESEHHYILEGNIPSHNTTSLLTEGQSGIEPLFSKAYKRVDRVGERSYIHPILLEYPEGDFPDWYVDAYDLKPEDHFETQVIIQKYIDSSVSKTINLPEHTKAEDLDKLLLEYVKDLKGVTVYRDKSRSPQILAPLSKEEIIEELKNNNITNSHDENAVQCASGSCDL